MTAKARYPKRAAKSPPMVIQVRRRQWPSSSAALPAAPSEMGISSTRSNDGTRLCQRGNHRDPTVRHAASKNLGKHHPYTAPQAQPAKTSLG